MSGNFGCIDFSEASVEGKGLIRAVNSDPGFEVLSNSVLFKEVCLPLEANRLHPFEGVSNPVVAVASEAEEELIGAKFDVIAHLGGPHEKMSFFQIASGPILSIPIHSKVCQYGPCKFSLKKNDPFLTYEHPRVSVFLSLVAGLVTD